MAVCWCVVASAGPVAAESVVPAPGRIARLIAERGTIRRQLEASYPSAGADLARAVLSESAEGLAPARDTNAHAQAGSRRRGGFPYGLVLVLMAVGALILYLNVVANFDP